MNPETKSVLELNPFMVYEYSQVTNSRETYCLDHIQRTKFQYRAFRYANLLHMPHKDKVLSQVNQTATPIIVQC